MLSITGKVSFIQCVGAVSKNYMTEHETKIAKSVNWHDFYLYIFVFLEYHFNIGTRIDSNHEREMCFKYGYTFRCEN